MKINSINNQWNNIAFRSGYPTFQSAGHLTFCSNKTPIHENTNPSDRQMSPKKGYSISFKGMPPYRHHANEGKECPPEGCQPIKPQVKVPPNGGILLHRHVDMLGNAFYIKG